LAGGINGYSYVAGNQLITLLNSLPNNSIQDMSLFNHGDDNFFIFADDQLITANPNNEVIIVDKNGNPIGALDNILNEKLKDQAEFEFRGCSTASGDASLSEILSRNLTDVSVTGYSTKAYNFSLRPKPEWGGINIGIGSTFRNGKKISSFPWINTGKASD
jgi:hypothetical protein